MRGLAVTRNCAAWLTLLGFHRLSLATNISRINLTPGVTPISRDIYWLHMTIFWICCTIGALVFGFLIYSLIKHRQSVGHRAHDFHSNAKIELTWTVIPLIILVLMAIPATIVLSRMSDDSKADLNIKITGYQWKWKYEYLNEDIHYFSNLSTPRAQIEGKAPKGLYYLLEVDNPLVVPIHKKIRLLVTSNDVIHSWWVPALGIKRDAIPGFIHESWARIEKPGTYRGQCAELCGINHAYMPIVVIAKTQADYEKWVASKTQPAETKPSEPAKDMTKAELMALGKKVYLNTCSVCHREDGSGSPPAFPSMRGGKIATGPLDSHINIVMRGKSGTAMQAFAGQLNDREIAAVITYERNAFGNDDQSKYGKNAGGLVQPKAIANARKEASHG